MVGHRRIRLALLLGFAFAVGLVVATSVTGATGGGSNGRIAFTKVLDAAQVWSMLPDGTRKTRLVSGAGLAYEGVLAPDGKRLVFVSTRDGDSEIYVATAAGGAPRQLTDNEAMDFDPSWSPDGRRLVFSSDRDGNFELYSMSAVSGTGVKRLTARPGSDENPAWSPTGKVIAFWSDRKGSADIYVMRPDGSGSKRLTVSRDDEKFAAWSPDGKRLAYTVQTEDDADIWIMSADGRNRKPLVRGDDSWWPSFSPDGTRIAYTSWDDIVVVGIDGKHRKTIAHEGHGASWGRTGRLVYTRTEFENHEIAVADVDGRNEKLLTKSPAYDGGASWSPDGLTLAFSSDRQRDEDLYVMDGNGDSLVRLLQIKGAQWEPSWSPGGERIVFVGEVGDMNFRLFVYDLASRAYRRVDTLAEEDDWDVDPAFSPDQRLIAFASDRERSWDLYYVDTVTGGVRRLTSALADEWAPSWSPDGAWIAYASDAAGDFDIWLRELATGKTRRLTSGPADDDYPEWSPDGRKIVFHRNLEDGRALVYAVNVDGSELVPVTNGVDPCGEPTWQSVAGT
jgi:Tol biopolymer transport system component